MLKTTKSSGGGILSLAAASLGLGTQDGIDFDKFNALAHSEIVKDKVLLKEGVIDGKSDLIAHHIIDDFKLRSAWADNPNFANIDFNEKGPVQDTVIVFLKMAMSKMYSVSETKEKFIIVKTWGGNQELAILLNKTIVSEVNNFFSERVLSKDLDTKRIVENKIDSIKKELFTNEILFADLKDQSTRMVKSRGHLDLLRAKRNVKILNEMYIEAIKQYEILSFRILNYNHSVDVVDSPKLPLRDTRKSFVHTGMVYSISGSLMCMLCIFAFNFYKKMKKGLAEVKKSKE